MGWGRDQGKQISFCNEVENDLGPDRLNERDLTLVGLAGLFETLPQPISVPPSQDPQREGERIGSCWRNAKVSGAGGAASTKVYVLSDPHC